jgi:hypothetical protein
MPRRVEGLEVELLPVALSRREVEDYYHGFANRTLWPLLHGLIEQPVFERRWWRAYREVNERFAAVKVGGGGLRWVHDYQLLLVPSLLRRAGAGPIGFFLHVPFPPPGEGVQTSSYGAQTKPVVFGEGFVEHRVRRSAGTNDCIRRESKRELPWPRLTAASSRPRVPAPAPSSPSAG